MTIYSKEAKPAPEPEPSTLNLEAHFGAIYREAFPTEECQQAGDDLLATGEQIASQDFLTIKVAELKTHRPDTLMRRTAYRVDVRASEKLKRRFS